MEKLNEFNEVFNHIPYAPTLEGQYIIKNMVLISAGLVIGSTVRGGRIIPDPTATPSQPGRHVERP